ncbi:hypothetical protein GCM10010156_12870 [Planobispora rosea]|uniref:Uncharacterized protein n=1 Tax=Planobispora rosea TaxID=35762 RepID=A0A8J3WD83_PLARO|nr:hypothetical protein [Planobispora rosea]GGS55778.1 hypothetical protein GCM10010156_12870 [Planobispora rosea]GIH83641.1 hypothetical protein Pro02_20490 [Planobispora rosea]
MRKRLPGCANTPAAGHPNKAPALSGLAVSRIGAATERNRAMSVNTETLAPPAGRGYDFFQDTGVAR